jgi:hypothetical protein
MPPTEVGGLEFGKLRRQVIDIPWHRGLPLRSAVRLASPWRSILFWAGYARSHG